uniref:OTU domain-containing protein n=1 Tax=Panagrellus redivivus TaxID=6233 RepID=A0A7E4W9Q3_PANRE
MEYELTHGPETSNLAQILDKSAGTVPTIDLSHDSITYLNSPCHGDSKTHTGDELQNLLARLMLALEFCMDMSVLLHDIRNKSCETTKSGKKKSVKNRLLTHGATFKNVSEVMVKPSPCSSDFKPEIVDDVTEAEGPDSPENEDDDADDNAEYPIATLTSHPELPSQYHHPQYDHAVAYELPSQPHHVAPFESMQPLGQAPPLLHATKIDARPTSKLHRFSSPSSEALTTVCGKLGIRFDINVHVPTLNQLLQNATSLSTINVPGDGHCGYSSLSVLLTGSTQHHMAIRRFICNKIADGNTLPKAFYELFGEGATKDARKADVIRKAVQKSNPGNDAMNRTYWFNECDAAALSYILDINIVVYDTRGFAGYWTLWRFLKASDALNLPSVGNRPRPNFGASF